MIGAAVSLGPLRSYSVCLAPDGHWSLEASHANAACETHRQRHHPADAVAAPELDAHPCVDLAIVPAADRGSRDAPVAVQAPTISTAVAVAPQRLHAAVARALGGAAASPPSPALLRSVVLVA